MKVFFYTILFFVFPVAVMAQTNAMRFTRITSNDGLSQNLVWTIFQDRKGFLWFGTKDGLNKYDGYKFTYYRHDPNHPHSLSPGHVQKLHECSSGLLWIAVGGKYIDILNEKIEQYYHCILPPLPGKQLGYSRITGIVETAPDEHWIRFDHGGMYRIKGSLKAKSAGESAFSESEIQFFDTLNSVSLLTTERGDAALSATASGTLWLNTDQGVVSIRNKTATLYTLPQAGNNSNEEVVWTERSAPDSSLWIAYQTTLLHIPRNGKEPGMYRLHFASESGEESQHVTATQEKNMPFWASTQNNIIDISTETHSVRRTLSLPVSLTNLGRQIFSMLQDQGGVLWIGTPGEGIFKYNPTVERFALLHEKNWWNIRYGSYERFLKRGVVARDDSSLFEANFNEYNIFTDSKNRKWIIDWSREAKGNRIVVYDPARRISKVYDSRTPPFQKFSFAMRGIAEDASGKIWIATYDGLSRFDTETEKIEHFIVRKDTIVQAENATAENSDITGIGTTFMADRNKNFWWDFSNRGLYCLNPVTLKLSVFKNKPGDSHSLSHNEVIAIKENPNDTADYLWVGTEGGGLNRLDKTTGYCIRYTTHEGLPNNVINGILFDKESNAWLSTNVGICKFNPQTGAVKTFDVNDGLQGNEFDRFKYFQSADGMMFFGGINGINAFYPGEVFDNTHIPPIVLTDLRLGNRSVEVNGTGSPLRAVLSETRELILPYKENVITFEFTALDFCNPGKNLYSYMLEGFNDRWSYPTTERTATYTNLDPGTYTFRVLGSNNDVVWNETGAVLTLIILPPWYMTWWFYALSALTVVGTAYGIVRKRIQRLQREREAQEEFSRELMASQEAERKRIAGELHDSVGQNILLMKNRAHFGIQGAQDLPSAHAQLSEIATLATDTLNQVREISHNLRPLHLDRLGLTQAIYMLLDQVERNSSIAIQADITPVDGLFDKEQEVNIFRIVQECLNNVLKHAKAKRVAVSTIVQEQVVRITIQDDGVGFDFDQKQRSTKHYGMGLSGLTERAKIIGGKLNIVSAPGKGTTTIVELPNSKSN